MAGAIDWPGWGRSGRDEKSALQALVDYGPRYARVLHNAGLAFQPPADTSVLVVIERLQGNATTDFGAPAIILAADRESIDQTEFERLRRLLLAGWQAFDSAAQQATGKALRKGPRGGGRDLTKILRHILEADQEYLRRLGWKRKGEEAKNLGEELELTRRAILNALEAAVKGQLPEQGPRGGIIWPPRYFIRRAAWHALDHAWEIEDRVV